MALCLGVFAQAKTDDVVKFGIVTDAQYDSDVKGEGAGRHYSEGVSRLTEAVDTFVGIPDLDFVVDLGDMTDRNPFCYGDLKAVKDRLKVPVHNAQDWNGGISLEQLSWLDAELHKADRKGQWAVLMCHIPLLPFDAGDSLWNAMEVIRLIESHPSVKAVLTGHRHEGGYILRNGIHHITFKGMVQGESNRYSVVRIDTASGRIEIDGYGDEPDRDVEIQ